jgi:hypothetical protein
MPSTLRHLPALLIVFACTARAEPTPAPVRAEIDGMLVRLEVSGCQFNRNGTWHEAADAKEHLLRKLAYMEREGTIQSAEHFIELAGSKSSSSDTPYLVKCGGGAPMASAAWLSSQLQLVRARAPVTSAPR